MVKKYGICDDKYGRDETANTLEKAEKIFELVKDNKMSNGVVIDESWVSIVESEDDFETETLIKKVIAVYDEETTKEIGTPEQNGYEWNYWAKWQEVSE